MDGRGRRVFRCSPSYAIIWARLVSEAMAYLEHSMSSSGPDDDPRPPAPAKPKGGGGGGGDPSDNCDIRERTRLNSPDRTVLSTLRVGDVLKLRLENGPPVVLLALDPRGRPAGSITSPMLPQIVRCIRLGRTYEAEIQVINGAVCEIQIRPS